MDATFTPKSKCGQAMWLFQIFLLHFFFEVTGFIVFFFFEFNGTGFFGNLAVAQSDDSKFHLGGGLATARGKLDFLWLHLPHYCKILKTF